MSLDTGVLIASGVLFALMIGKKRTGSLIIEDPIGEFPGDPSWDHWPTTTGTNQEAGNTGSGVITQENGNTGIVQPGLIPVMIDYIGVFPVSYATVSGSRRNRINLGGLRCL